MSKKKKLNKNLIFAQKKQVDGIDGFRLAAAFLVVAIHTSPFASFSADADFIFTRVIARTAVPFFLMVTGYFLLPRYLFKGSMDYRPLFRVLKKLLCLYLAAVLLYFPVNLYAGQFEGISTGGILRMLFIDGTFYHLWYLPAAIVGITVVILAGGCGQNRKMPFGGLAVICTALYGVGLFGDSYYGLAQQIPVIKSVYDLLFSISSYTRNGLFYAPLFLVMGAAMHKSGENGMICEKEGKGKGTAKEETVHSLAYAMGLVTALALMTAEGMILHRLNLQRHDSMYFTLPLVMFFLFRILLTKKAGRPYRWGKRLRGLSTCIYLIHPFCIILVRGAAKAVGPESLLVGNSLVHYLAVCVVSFAGACIIAAAAERVGAHKPAFGGKTAFGEGEIPGERAVFGGGTLSGKERSFERGRAWIEVSRENLAKNVEVLRSFLAPGQRLMPALKADAYGHGAALIAGELQKMGIDAFCVACAAEGVELRRNGITGDILILGYTHPQDFWLLRKYRLTQTVVDCHYGTVLNRYGGRGKKMRVQVKIDTGMHRLGERAESMKEIERIFRMKRLKVEGIYTHLCADETREEADMAYTRRQAALFYEDAEQLKKRGYTGLKMHLLASYGLVNYPELGGDYVRTGIALYGLLSDRKLKKPAQSLLDGLRPVLRVKARIAVVKDLYQGETAGYGLAYTAPERRKIAVLAIGYADGLPRSLSNGKGRVLIHGKSAPVIGRICMDQTIVDVTEIKNVRPGECAAVIGRDGEQEITVYELAEKAGTITNEILSRLGARLPRILAK